VHRPDRLSDHFDLQRRLDKEQPDEDIARRALPGPAQEDRQIIPRIAGDP